MKFPESGLRAFVDPGVGRDELVQRLTMAGLEVESVEVLGAGLDDIRVAQVLDVEPHPDAARLRVCRVDAGEGIVQIVCGAPNVRPGLRAALAPVGSRLPDGRIIGEALLRGVVSQGMLCSAAELGLSDDASGLLELPERAEPGQSLAELLGLPDASIELKVTPNRSDCLGLWGLAHEVSAIFSVPLRQAPKAEAEVGSARTLAIDLEASAACPRYLGRMLLGIDNTRPSPPWLVEALRRSGLRSLGPVVDVTNYVMLELGQPLHAFDAACIEGGIRVRWAEPGERLVLLDDREVGLEPDMLVIADARRALALAGIMGGSDSRVTETTRDVFLESAHFSPQAILGRARRLGLSTDASYRFERGVDPEMPRLAIERATCLLLEICGGRAGPVVEAVDAQQLPQRPWITLRRQRLQRLLGVEIGEARIVSILRSLGMELEATVEGWRVRPPSRRFDLAIEEDLIEEVVRVHGYDLLPARLPEGAVSVELPEALRPQARQRDRLLARGYSEAITYSFVSRALLERWGLEAGAIPLANPLSQDLAVMRTSLLPGLVEALRHNRHRQQARVRLCEFGAVFVARDDGGHDEPQRVAGVALGSVYPEGWAQARHEADFYDLKGDVEALAGGLQLRWVPSAEPWLHPGRSAAVYVGEQRIGHVGSLHPRLQAALELRESVQVFELDLAAISQQRLPCARELPRYPSIRRDLAVLLPRGSAYAELEDCLKAALGNVLDSVICFDRYLGAGVPEGWESLAIGLILQDRSRTLTDRDADLCVQQGMEALARRFNARLRG